MKIINIPQSQLKIKSFGSFFKWSTFGQTLPQNATLKAFFNSCRYIANVLHTDCKAGNSTKMRRLRCILIHFRTICIHIRP